MYNPRFKFTVESSTQTDGLVSESTWSVSKPGKHFRGASDEMRHFMIKPAQPGGDFTVSFDDGTAAQPRSMQSLLTVHRKNNACTKSWDSTATSSPLNLFESLSKNTDLQRLVEVEKCAVQAQFSRDFLTKFDNSEELDHTLCQIDY